MRNATWISRILAALALTSLLLAGCTRQTTTTLSIDLVDLAGEDTSTTLAASLIVNESFYVGDFSEGADLTAPNGGYLLDLSESLGEGFVDEITSLELEVGISISPTIDLDTFDVGVYVGDEGDEADVFLAANLIDSIELEDIAADASGTGTITLTLEEGSALEDALSTGAIRVGFLLSATSTESEIGEDITFTWSSGTLELTLTPGGLLP